MKYTETTVFVKKLTAFQTQTVAIFLLHILGKLALHIFEEQNYIFTFRIISSQIDNPYS
jgi:hypothetical protein